MRRIYRSRTDRVLAGVAGGLATYFNIDPLLVRVVLVMLALMNGFGILLYMLLWLLVPNEGSLATDTREQMRENVAEMQQAAQSAVDRVRSAFQQTS